MKRTVAQIRAVAARRCWSTPSGAVRCRCGWWSARWRCRPPWSLVLGLVLQTQIAGRMLQGKEVDALGQAEAGAAVLERELAGVDPDRRRRAGRAEQGAGPADERLAVRRRGVADGRRVPGRAHHRPAAGRSTGPGGQVAAGTVADVPADLRGHVAEGSLAAPVRHDLRPGRRDPHSDHRSAGAHRGPRPGVLPAVPARRRAAHALAGAEHADRRRPRAAPAARRDREPRDPPGGPAGAAGRRDRRAVRRRAPRRTHAGARQRRGGAAGRVVQRDGREHPGPDPPARGVRRTAAAVHLGRQPRAAHPADHRADGRGRAARLEGRSCCPRCAAAPSCW